MIASLLICTRRHIGFSLALVVLLSGCATTGSGDPQDPFESFNRGVYKFNETADEFVFHPIARGYNTITPSIVDEGVTNFFSNLAGIIVVANDLLQLKGEQAVADTLRFVYNSTFGILGFFDVSSYIGLSKHNEDFGQTLGYWGMGAGPYLVLPFLGPSTVRDTGGLVADTFLNPITYIDDAVVQASLSSLGYIDIKSDLLDTRDLVKEAALDEYDFVKSAYLERRRNLIKDRESTDLEDDYEGFEF